MTTRIYSSVDCEQATGLKVAAINKNYVFYLLCLRRRRRNTTTGGMLGGTAAAGGGAGAAVLTVSGGPLGAPSAPDPALARCADLRAREERLLREVAAALGHHGGATPHGSPRHVSVSEVEDLYLRCGSDYVLDTSAPAGGAGPKETEKQPKRRSSTELYREAAALWGLTCRMSDSCRCLDCQSRYFDCEPDGDEERPAELAAGTPALLDHVLTHPVTCSLL